MNELVPKEAIEHFEKVRAEQNALRQLGINMNFVTPIVFKGQKAWAIRNRVYHSRPPQETFHEFIVFVLFATLGQEWFDRQKAEADKHFIIQCYEAFLALKSKAAVPANQKGEHLWSVDMDGPTKYLLSLAFDVASLAHAQPIPERLLNRLRDRNQFQGARYELGIAAIFARLGFDVQFLDGTIPEGKKHCEFVAKRDSLEIAVEAKSRHLPGVIHTKGVQDQEKALKGEVRQLFEDAQSQAPGGKPFLIFIDVNAPPSKSAKEVEGHWYGRISEILRNTVKVTPGQPTIPTAVYATNYAYHYQQDHVAGNELSEHISSFPRNPINDLIFFTELVTALQHYGTIPSFDVDGVLH